MGTTPTYPIPIGGMTLAGITMVAESDTFDPAQGVKRWIDASKASLPGDQPANYMVFDAASGTEVPLRISNAVAARANVPKIYPSYRVQPTKAQLAITRPGYLPLLLAVPEYSLSTEDQANALALEIGPALGLQLQVTLPVGTGTFTPNGDARQQFMLTSGAISANAGYLLQAKNANGIGAPGNWALNASNQIVWNAVPVPQVGPNTPADIPAPVRALLPGESFRPGGLPGIWEVINTGTMDPAAPATAGQIGQLLADIQLIKQFLCING